MEIEKHLAELAQADPQARRTALENALTAEGPAGAGTLPADGGRGGFNSEKS